MGTVGKTGANVLFKSKSKAGGSMKLCKSDFDDYPVQRGKLLYHRLHLTPFPLHIIFTLFQQFLGQIKRILIIHINRTISVR